MAVYYINEAAFEVEDGAFTDRTVHVLEASEARPGDVSLLISRSLYPAGESLLGAVRRHLERESRTFRGWQSLFVKEARADGAPVVDVGTRWRGKAGLVYQRQAHIGLEAEILLVVASGPIAEREACDAHLERTLRTLRIRQE